MILEVASLMVQPGQQAGFERAFARAEQLIRHAAGYLSHELRRSLEREHHYALLIEWRRLEDHTLGFVKSQEFQHLAELLRPFLITAPRVEHFRAVTAPDATRVAD